MEKFNLAEYCLQENARRFPDKYALIIAEKDGSERKFTYQDLYHQVACLVSGFASLKLEKGAVVAIQAEDAHDLLLSFLAAIAANLVPVLLLQSLVDESVEYILKHSNASIFLQLDKNSKKKFSQQNYCIINLEEYQQLVRFPFREIHTGTQMNDPAFIFYTSGSTGAPKGVVHAQRVILGRMPSIKYWMDLRSDDVVMQTDNLCWTYSLFTGFLDPLMMGATAVVYNPSNFSSLAENAISGKTWLQLINRYNVTIMASTPDIYHLILDTDNLHEYQHSSLRMAGSAGTLLAESVQKQWKNIFGIPIYTALGMTEISTCISTGLSIPPKAQTIGKIQPGRHMRLLPIETGFDDVTFDQVGMLAVHKDEQGLMLGYLGENSETSLHYRGDWFLTQDLLSMDKDGYLTYCGRLDSIIKVGGGFRVSPIQVENVIKSYEKIKDVVCTAIFDQHLATDVLAAYIVCDQPDDVSAKALCEYIRQHLTDYKMPQYFFFVDEIPHNMRGKVDRKKLAEVKKIFTWVPVKLEEE